jgi:hypothetical protein
MRSFGGIRRATHPRRRRTGHAAAVTVTDAVPGATAAAVAALAEEQWRVAGLLATADRRGGWDQHLAPEQRRRRVRLGHFPAYSAELDWTPREVAGHLRDSAQIFTERLRRLRTEDRPVLADFATDDPTRLAGYRATPPARLVEELRGAQAELLAAVAAIGVDDLARVGVHEVDGELAVAGVLAFLPGHQRDHADQLAALLNG